MTHTTKTGMLIVGLLLGTSLALAIILLALNIKNNDTFFDKICRLEIVYCENEPRSNNITWTYDSITPSSSDGIQINSITPRDLYFIMTVEDTVVEKIGQPIEGFEQQMFLSVYPNLRASDFEGVELVGDNNSGIETSADAAITKQGMKTLLENISERLNVPIETQADIDAILLEISRND